MQYNLETFSSDLIIERLVEWFNAQPIQDRTVSNGELFIVKVKVLANATGEPVFVIGTDPTTSDPSRWYMGESVFMWVGPTGTNLTATESSFFEMSRNVPAPLNVLTTFATLGTAPSEPIVRRMAFGMNYSSGSSNSAPYANWTVGISQDGKVEMDVHGSYYMNPPNSLLNLPEVMDVTSGSGFVAARTVDNDVYVWGENNSIHPNIYNGPVQIMYDPQTEYAMKAKRIAALKGLLIFIREDGTLGYVGETYQTRLQDEPYSLSQFQNVKDIRGYYWYDYNNTFDGYELLSILMEDGTLKFWGWRSQQGDEYEAVPNWSEFEVNILSIGGAYDPVTNVKDVAFNRYRALVLHTDGTVSEYGGSGYYLNIPDSDKVVAIAATIEGGLGALTESGDVYVSPSPYSLWSKWWEGCTLLSGGWDYIIAAVGGTSKQGYSSYYGSNGFDLDVIPAQIQGGVETAALNLHAPQASEVNFITVRYEF